MQTDAVPNFTASSQISRICSQVDGCFNNVWSTLFKTSLYVIFLIVPFHFFSGGSNFQRFPCKSERKKLLQKVFPDLARAIHEDDPERLRIAEFRHHLAADAAGRAEIFRFFSFWTSDDGDRPEFCFPSLTALKSPCAPHSLSPGTPHFQYCSR